MLFVNENTTGINFYQLHLTGNMHMHFPLNVMHWTFNPFFLKTQRYSLSRPSHTGPVERSDPTGTSSSMQAATSTDGTSFFFLTYLTDALCSKVRCILISLCSLRCIAAGASVIKAISSAVSTQAKFHFALCYCERSPHPYSKKRKKEKKENPPVFTPGLLSTNPPTCC